MNAKGDRSVPRGVADGATSTAEKQAGAAERDPGVGKFLEFLARDMADQPARIRPMPKSLLARGKVLVEDIKVDLDAKLPDDGE